MIADAIPPLEVQSLPTLPMMAESKLVSTTVLVTGGSGLVGHGIQWLVGTQGGGPTARRDGENWVFLSSADGDLRQENPSILPLRLIQATDLTQL